MLEMLLFTLAVTFSDMSPFSQAPLPPIPITVSQQASLRTSFFPFPFSFSSLSALLPFSAFSFFSSSAFSSSVLHSFLAGRDDFSPFGERSNLNTLASLLQNSGLAPAVIEKVLTIMSCTQELNIPDNHILTIIDYSLPSNQKRLWTFDLTRQKLLFYTYVGHGIKSGGL